MAAKLLWQIGALVITLLAGMHLYYTFFTNKFFSRNNNVVAEMKASSPILTKDLTMWNAWIGFNASHSMGGIFIGVLNLYLASRYFKTFQSDHFFFLFNISTIAFYVWLAKRYWFKTPLKGLAVTLVCFVVSYILNVLDSL